MCKCVGGKKSNTAEERGGRGGGGEIRERKEAGGKIEDRRSKAFTGKIHCEMLASQQGGLNTFFHSLIDLHLIYITYVCKHLIQLLNYMSINKNLTSHPVVVHHK